MLKSFGVLSVFIALSTATPTTLLLESIASRIIHRDVAIIGAGASGAYAAIRLKEDFHKSIIVRALSISKTPLMRIGSGESCQIGWAR